MRALLAVLLAASVPAVHATKAGMTLATASLLTQHDLGSGWAGKPTPQSGATFNCKGFSPSGAGITETGGASSATFSYGSPATIFLVQATSVYATAAQANTYWGRAVTPGLLSCAVQTLQALTTRGVSVKITQSGLLSFKTALAHTKVYRVVGVIGKNKLKSYLDVIVLGDGPAITEITITSIETAPPASFEQILAHVAIRHLGGLPA